MYPIDQSRQMYEHSSQILGDDLDGADCHSLDDRQAPLWSLPGFIKAEPASDVPMPPPSSFEPQTQEPSLGAGGALMQQQHPSYTTSHGSTHLDLKTATLTQTLSHTTQALATSQRQTRDLATWALQDRTRLLLEAQHQRQLREDYEAILRQRDEQIVYLLALHQEAKLEHARSLVREGEALGRPVAREWLRGINGMRRRVGLLGIDRFGAVEKVGMGSDEGMEDCWMGSAGEALKEGEIAEEEEAEIADDEEGETVDEEGAYSPPGAARASSIDAQVDELIAEEAGREMRW